MKVLVFNVGSTTLKYAIIDSESSQQITGGLVDRIGSAQATTEAQTHESATQHVLAKLKDSEYHAIGHRIVHGGESFQRPTLVTDSVLEKLELLDTLAPLHNPPARKVVRQLQETEKPQVLVFDTAWYSTIPEHAYRYAVPEHLLTKHGVRKYGFHGTSHQFVTEKALDFLKQNADGGRRFDRQSARIISLHLGGGASASASVGGIAIDTSMGMTPLDGLVMASRSGSIDPSIPLYLIQNVGMSAGEVDRMLNKESGLIGLCGESDMRTILAKSSAGDDAASLAIRIFVQRILKTVGSYVAVLGGIDALVFTAGIGENSADIRAKVLSGLSVFGVQFDAVVNTQPVNSVTELSVGTVKALVVPTNEELAIAMQVARLSPFFP